MKKTIPKESKISFNQESGMFGDKGEYFIAASIYNSFINSKNLSIGDLNSEPLNSGEHLIIKTNYISDILIPGEEIFIFESKNNTTSQSVSTKQVKKVESVLNSKDYKYFYVFTQVNGIKPTKTHYAKKLIDIGKMKVVNMSDNEVITNNNPDIDGDELIELSNIIQSIDEYLNMIHRNNKDNPETKIRAKTIEKTKDYNLLLEYINAYDLKININGIKNVKEVDKINFKELKNKMIKSDNLKNNVTFQRIQGEIISYLLKPYLTISYVNGAIEKVSQIKIIENILNKLSNYPNFKKEINEIWRELHSEN